MRRKVEVLIWLVATVLLLAGTVRAEDDVVILKTGMKLTGKILSESGKDIEMEVDGLGRMVVPLDKIRTINGKEPVPTEPPPVVPVPANPPPEKKPDPAPDVAREPPTKPNPKPEPEPEPEPPVSRADVPYGELKKGQSLLFILKGKDHGDWVETGRRVIAEVALVGKMRFKIVIDPQQGILGEEWVRKENLVRAIRLDEKPERRLMFFSEGVGSGSWIQGATAIGAEFEGRLGGVTTEGAITIWRPEGDRVEKTVIQLLELKWLKAITRSRALKKSLDSIAVGEPVEITIHGREAPLTGRVARVDRQWITLDTADPRKSESKEEHVFRGLPITGLSTLPEAMRKGLSTISDDGWVTLETKTEDEEMVILRSVTGQIRFVSLTEVSLVAPDGEESFPVATIQSFAPPATERIPALTARKDESTEETVLPVLPGMTRAEVEKRIPVGLAGIDLLYEDDRVTTVFLRAPFPGPVFGIRFNDPLSKALTRTDLVFDVQMNPKVTDSGAAVTMVSRTLNTLEVRLLVSNGGDILAMEVSGR